MTWDMATAPTISLISAHTECAFYYPKESSQAQLLEAKANLVRMKQEVPLSEEECAAVDDGLAALEKLCEKLTDVPTPSGSTPRQLRANDLIQIRTGNRSKIIASTEEERKTDDDQ